MTRKKKKRKTIGKMTQNRGVMPPPTVKDEDKRKKNDRRKSKQEQKAKIKRGDYDV
ncbi:hypothetical protein PQE68_gp067 [Bacillus phage vB_BanS_Sophrita]|uniref:Uncharacterized protein n=1 Tax=Bacillus phage vB_BanS_Sophrita TaxID=2894790 RepID=A0AAE8YVD5_9CAUD|nr:hypothetical protein PQE68_gp067 [Bacillus phage vB_BanS_Sophrita]UGO50658.1 hypothetical protein SOPHRITA_67 [Bacillus phage vB_BanS_Sophrita]